MRFGWDFLERKGTALLYTCEVALLSLPRLSHVSGLLGRNSKEERNFTAGAVVSGRKAGATRRRYSPLLILPKLTMQRRLPIFSSLVKDLL